MKKYLVINFNSRIHVPIAANLADAGNLVYELVLQVDLNKARNNTLIRDAVTDFKPEIILSLGWWQGNIDLTQYEEIVTKSGALHTYWTYDDPIYLEHLCIPLLKFTHLIFTTDGDSVAWYNRNGQKAAFLPFACDPSFHKKTACYPRYKNDIVLLANNYNLKRNDALPDRIIGINNILRPLLNGQYDVKVYGLWWLDKNRVLKLDRKYYGGVVQPKEICQVYSSAKIALGLSSVGSSSNMVSMRVFETLGCGILYLSQYTPALKYFFHNEEHLLWSGSPEETLSYVQFYLRNDAAREKLARQGQQLVYLNHTYAHRARQLTSILKQEFNL